MPLPKLKSNPFLHHSFFIFIIRFFPSLANLLVLLYYSRRLDKPTYGTYQNFWIQLNFIYPIACFGIHALIITYAPETIIRLFRNITARQYFFYGLWLIVLSVGFGLLQAMSMHIGFVIPALFMLTFAMGIIIESSLILFRRFRSLALINLLYAAAYLAIHKLVLEHGFSFENLFLSLLAINVIRLAISIILVNISIKKSALQDTGTRPIEEIRKLWVHLGFYDILQTLSTWIDKFIVSLVLTASLSAIYFNGSQNIPFLPLIMNAAGSSVLMQLINVKASDETASLLEMMKQSGKYLSNIVFPIFLYLLFFRYEIFSVLLPDYMVAVPVFFISLFILPFRAYSFITVFQKLHQGHIGNVGAVMELIIACALMYPLYLWLGLPGVALSFIISSYLQGAYYLYHMGRLMHTSPLNVLPLGNWLIKMALFGLLFFAAHYFTSRLFIPKVAVILGGLLMMSMVIISFIVEYVNAKRHGNS